MHAAEKPAQIQSRKDRAPDGKAETPGKRFTNLDIKEFIEQPDSADRNGGSGKSQQLEHQIEQRQKPQEKNEGSAATAAPAIDKPKTASPASGVKEADHEEKIASGPATAAPVIEKPKAASPAGEAEEARREEKGTNAAAPQVAKAAVEREKPGEMEPKAKTAKMEAAGKQGPPPISMEKLPYVLKDVKQLGEKGELVIALVSDRPIQDYKTFFLDKPPRQVVDFPGKWQIAGQTEINVHSDIAQRIRLGIHPDKLRLVVDLTINSLLSPVIEKSPKGLTILLRKKS